MSLNNLSMSDETKRVLINTFGTCTPGDCKRCNETRHIRHFKELPCGESRCKILLKLEIITLKERNPLNPEIKKMENKLTRMGLLGLDEELAPPWLFMKSTEGSGTWFNVKSQVYSGKIYNYMVHHDNILICGKGEKGDPGAEVYSSLCGNTNIGEGIPSLRMDTNIITLNWGARIASGETRNNNFVCLLTTEPNSKMTFRVVISKYGDRLITNNSNMLIVDEIGENRFLIQMDRDQCIRVDSRLNVINKSNTVMAMKI